MKDFSIITIFKYIIVALIIAYATVLLIFSGGSNKSFKSVSKSVEAKVDKDILTKEKMQSLKRYYGLNGADYEGVTLYISKSSMSAEELLIIKTKTEDQVDAIQDAIMKRKETRKQDFEGYAPDEADLVDASILQVRGKFVFFAISKDAQKYKKTFVNSL